MDTLEVKDEIRIERKVEAVLLYFKLVYLRSLTADKTESSFIMLNGDKVEKRVNEDMENGLIPLDMQNVDLILELEKRYNELLESKSSVSKIYDREFENVSWLVDLVKMTPDLHMTTADKTLEALDEDKIETHNDAPISSGYVMCKHIKNIEYLARKRKNS